MPSREKFDERGNDAVARAEGLMARERVLQEMRAARFMRQREVRRRMLLICVPAGIAIGAGTAFGVSGPVLGFGLGGAGFGVLAAALLARISS
jgi:hypothetical protein